MQIDPGTGAAQLGAALAAGLLVGLERGWREREQRDGGRVAGLRTFALIGLLGGVLGLWPSGVPLGVGLAGVAALFAVSYGRASQESGTLSITTAVAGLVTFGLGALAGQGHLVLAVAGAAVVALLLDLKGVLHGWLRRIDAAELNAVLQLGVLTVVVLPLLPDAGYGPYAAINPFQLWIAVILIASLSLTGHVATRLRGRQQGLLWVGLLGGLASSTAATLSLSRSARNDPAISVPASAGVMAACGVMFLRMALVVWVLQAGTQWRLTGLLVWLGVASFATAAWLWARRGEPVPGKVQAQPKLFDLASAFGFAAMLGVVAVVVRAADELLGVPGVYMAAFLSGLADVDAIVISTVQMHARGELAAVVTGYAILLAVVANMLVKACIAWVVGGRAVGRAVTGGYLVVALAGLAASLV